MHVKCACVKNLHVICNTSFNDCFLFKLSLKSLAFDALITPDKESVLSRLQSACIEGDVETFTAIQSNSPSKLDSFIALNVKIRSYSLYFAIKSVCAVLILQ